MTARPDMRALAAVLALAVLGGLASAARAHGGDPRFRSEVRSITPQVEGLEAWVVDFDDTLVLRNRSDLEVVVEDYEGEPFVRIDADGVVSVNERSSLYRLSGERHASAPPTALTVFAHEEDGAPREGGDPAPAPRGDPSDPDWVEIDRSARHDWHDRRIRWTGEEDVPPQVADPSERTTVFDWEIPIRVDGRRGAIAGTLVWAGDETGFPLAAAISLAALAVLGIAAVALVRRRRGRVGGEAGAGS